MIFALVGNQNCGKTTLFNQLTGSNQHVGNFPGVTVDQKMGELRAEKGCMVVDLPGIYSIRPYTSEEIVTRDFILNEKPDDSSIVRRVDSDIRSQDCLLDGLYHGCFPRLDLQDTRLRNRDVSNLLQRSRCSIIVYLQFI